MTSPDIGCTHGSRAAQMKRRNVICVLPFTILLFLLCAVALYADTDSESYLSIQDPPTPPSFTSTSLFHSHTWDLAVQIGIERLFTPNFGIRGSPGTSLLLPAFIADGSMFLQGELAGIVIQELNQGKNRRGRWGAIFGIPNFSSVWYRDDETGKRAYAMMISFGGSLTKGWSLRSVKELRFRFGGGFPVFYENGVWVLKVFYSIDSKFYSYLFLEFLA